MKLRNKKTGEIATVEGFGSAEDEIQMTYTIDNDETKLYCTPSLTTFNEEWEDYKELKEYYWIDYDGEVKTFVTLYEWQEKMKELGNYFETKEEAEKAVEKLKAWKRLKDNGFEFDGIILEGSNCLIKTKLKDNTGVTFDHAQQFYEDVDLLFGGEE
jgi:hypothetical protein